MARLHQKVKKWENDDITLKVEESEEEEAEGKQSAKKRKLKEKVSHYFIVLFFSFFVFVFKIHCFIDVFLYCFFFCFFLSYRQMGKNQRKPKQLKRTTQQKTRSMANLNPRKLLLRFLIFISIVFIHSKKHIL